MSRSLRGLSQEGVWGNSRESYVGRVLWLILLAPDIVEAILGGRQPALIGPTEWSRWNVMQRGRVGADGETGDFKGLTLSNSGPVFLGSRGFFFRQSADR